MSDSVWPYGQQPTRLLYPRDSLGKNTGVGCHFLLQCMHAKLLQSCPTLCDPMDSSPPGSSVHGILQARILEWVAISFSLNVLDVPKIDEGVWTFKDYRLNSSVFWRASHVQCHRHPKILSFEISKVIFFLITNRSKYCLSHLHLEFYQRNYSI